jgi:hypothetical protein
VVREEGYAPPPSQRRATSRAAPGIVNVLQAFRQSYLRSSSVRVRQLQAVRTLFAQLTLLRVAGKLLLRLRRVRHRLRLGELLFPRTLAWLAMPVADRAVEMITAVGCRRVRVMAERVREGCVGVGGPLRFRLGCHCAARGTGGGWLRTARNLHVRTNARS